MWEYGVVLDDTGRPVQEPSNQATGAEYWYQCKYVKREMGAGN